MLCKQVSTEDKEFIDSYMRHHADNLCSEFDFVTGFIWSGPGEYCMAAEDGILYLYNKYRNGSVTFAPPVSLEHYANLTDAVAKIKHFCREQNVPFLISGFNIDWLKRVDEELLHTLNVVYDRDSAEYIYKISDLIQLKETKSLRDKMNRIIKFENSYSYKFREYTPADYNKLFDLFDIWTEHSHEASKMERLALKLTLDNYKNFGVKCGVIEIDGVIAAFSAGSLMYSGQPQILFEKADIKYYGIYQAINKYFLEKFYSDYEFVNRQEDLGIEGLRRSKMSYSPILIIDKYRLEEKKYD